MTADTAPRAAPMLSLYALIDLDTLKLALGIESANTTEDVLLTFLINLATDRIEQDTKRPLHWRAHRLVVDGSGRPDLYVPGYPITAVAQVRVADVDLIPWLLDDQDDMPVGCGVVVYQRAGRFHALGSFPAGVANIRIEYSAGYGTDAGQPPIPFDLQEACVLLAADGYQTRKTGTWNSMNLSVAGQTLNLSPDMLWRRYRSIIAPYRHLEAA